MKKLDNEKSDNSPKVNGGDTEEKPVMKSAVTENISETRQTGGDDVPKADPSNDCIDGKAGNVNGENGKASGKFTK